MFAGSIMRRPLATASFRTIYRSCEIINCLINMSAGHPMPNGDPTVFGFPCRFPAAPSIRRDNHVQDFDKKRLSGKGASREKNLP